MKKSRKILTAVVAASAMAFSAFSLAACGDKSVNGTYKLELTKEECAGNIHLTGFMDSAGVVQTNTLVLKDGNYSLTKHLVSTAETEGQGLGVDVTITFTGTYTFSGKQVTLSKAGDAEFKLDYGVFNAMNLGPKNDEGKASAGDKVEDFGEHSHDPRDFFGGAFYNWVENGNVETKITVDAGKSTYAYVVSESSDDD